MKNKRIILTGATGGIGSQLASLLHAAGARLTLVDLDKQALENARVTLGADNVHTVRADITNAEDRNRIVEETLQQFGGVDILINSAGINPFGIFAEQDAALIQKTIEINTIAPILLTHAVLPYMLEQNSGHIINIGSTFGSIGFAWFSAYSASKFALRGFSQSLRRELDGSGVDLTYIAPRAVKTGINSSNVYAMAEAVKMKMDEPAAVAAQIVNSIRKRKKECYIGFPESLFVRINAVIPGLVDTVVRKQNRVARKFAAGNR